MLKRFLNCHLYFCCIQEGEELCLISWCPGLTETLSELSGECPTIIYHSMSAQELSFVLHPLPTQQHSNSLIWANIIENLKYKKNGTNQKDLSYNKELLKSQHLILFPPFQSKTIATSLENWCRTKVNLQIQPALVICMNAVIAFSYVSQNLFCWLTSAQTLLF